MSIAFTVGISMGAGASTAGTSTTPGASTLVSKGLAANTGPAAYVMVDGKGLTTGAPANAMGAGLMVGRRVFRVGASRGFTAGTSIASTAGTSTASAASILVLMMGLAANTGPA